VLAEHFEGGVQDLPRTLLGEAAPTGLLALWCGMRG